MTPEQVSAFQAGSSATPDEISLLFLGLLCAALFLWAAWVCLGAFAAFASGATSLKQLGSVIGRMVLLLIISIWLILS